MITLTFFMCLHFCIEALPADLSRSEYNLLATLTFMGASRGETRHQPLPHVDFLWGRSNFKKIRKSTEY
jgi:hypothetical protein